MIPRSTSRTPHTFTPHTDLKSLTLHHCLLSLSLPRAGSTGDSWKLQESLTVTALPFGLQTDGAEMRKRGLEMRRVLPRSEHQWKMLGVAGLLQPGETLFLLSGLHLLFQILAFLCPRATQALCLLESDENR